MEFQKCKRVQCLNPVLIRDCFITMISTSGNCSLANTTKTLQGNIRETEN